MKVIEVPADITINLMDERGTKTSKPAKFKEWAENVIDFYSEVKTMKQVRQVQKIVDAIGAGNGKVEMEDADYDLLKAAVDASAGKLPPFIVRQQLPFVDAVDKAVEVKK